jgi:hypothetical protein
MKPESAPAYAQIDANYNFFIIKEGSNKVLLTWPASAKLHSRSSTTWLCSFVDAASANPSP